MRRVYLSNVIVDDAATKTNAVALPLAFILVDHDHDVVMSHESTRSRCSKRRILNEEEEERLLWHVLMSHD